MDLLSDGDVQAAKAAKAAKEAKEAKAGKSLLEVLTCERATAAQPDLRFAWLLEACRATGLGPVRSAAPSLRKFVDENVRTLTVRVFPGVDPMSLDRWANLHAVHLHIAPDLLPDLLPDLVTLPFRSSPRIRPQITELVLSTTLEQLTYGDVRAILVGLAVQLPGLQTLDMRELRSRKPFSHHGWPTPTLPDSSSAEPLFPALRSLELPITLLMPFAVLLAPEQHLTRLTAGLSDLRVFCVGLHYHEFGVLSHFGQLRQLELSGRVLLSPCEPRRRIYSLRAIVDRLPVSVERLALRQIIHVPWYKGSARLNDGCGSLVVDFAADGGAGGVGITRIALSGAGSHGERLHWRDLSDLTAELLECRRVRTTGIGEVHIDSLYVPLHYTWEGSDDSCRRLAERAVCVRLDELCVQSELYWRLLDDAVKILEHLARVIPQRLRLHDDELLHISPETAGSTAAATLEEIFDVCSRLRGPVC